MIQQTQQQNLMAHMMSMNATSASGKKQRELYVGNLQIGLVNNHHFLHTRLSTSGSIL